MTESWSVETRTEYTAQAAVKVQPGGETGQLVLVTIRGEKVRTFDTGHSERYTIGWWEVRLERVDEILATLARGPLSIGGAQGGTCFERYLEAGLGTSGSALKSLDLPTYDPLKDE